MQTLERKGAVAEAEQLRLYQNPPTPQRCHRNESGEPGT